MVVNLMTPETATTTWYHWGMVRNFQMQDRGLTFRIRDAQASVFAEDMDILNGQQQNMMRRPERRLLDLKIDSGGVYANGIVEQELARRAERNISLLDE